jgi:DNA-binding response OmpR family regulator
MKLEKLGYEVVSAMNGTGCIQLVSNGDIDLVLLDIMMPDMSGTEVLAELRKEFSPFELPIIMQTGKSEAADIVHSFKLGANDYITKPVNLDVAQARINTQLTLKQLSNETARRAEVETAQAMIVTYNHEINNPLTIALGMLRKVRKENDSEYAQKAMDALMRVADIVHKIDALANESEVRREEYASNDDMISLKKSS